MSDARVMRSRQSDASDYLDRSAQNQPYGNAAMCVITATQTTYPTSPGSYFAAHPTILSAVEQEGSPATFTDDTSTWVYGMNLGSAIPGVGTRLIFHGGSGRWAFRYDG